MNSVAPALFSATGLKFRIGFQNVSPGTTFVLNQGKTVWISGPSGKGKSTLLRTIARLAEPAGGDMFLQGISWQNIAALSWRMRIVYIQQKPVLFRGTVCENLRKAFSFRCRSSAVFDEKTAQSLLSRLLLPSDIMDRDAISLSVGEGARVTLVRALLVDPEILLIDEITAALDRESRDEVISLIQEWLLADGRGVVAVSHDDRLKELLPGTEIVLE
ncbi:ABC transporter ATP-binding protein [Desulfomonile tiedjei]|uniref:ABC-type uncharacterized transport system, ATPase component n=1 Tax=Desulfomonile tiedjei (strain ATCC 49306 / DSM 6799 / DCB-1) TaxID=706587 RepID=I4C6G7_DESTA|nr:ATP-binding cassette domain-containing protein [Desulfomonile tiedjei]AFM25158.1 ABC-type uncharacterized transport system, ATPase component [Desulfomonile tiedjei DSM 6799]